jgi:Outer membrane protein beta-barrel domain
MRALGLALCLIAAAGLEASAQARPRSFELAAGAIWTTGSSFGRDEATETRNQTGGGSFPLFVASSEIGAGPGAEARLAFYLTPSVAIEAGGLFAFQQVSTRLTSDAENIPDTTAVEDLSEYIIDGAVAYHFRPLGRVVPFIRGGVGYLRQLHEGQTLAETGTAYHAGGGVSYWLSSGGQGFFKGWGLRGDARVVIRDGGFSLDDENRTGVVVTGALVMAF